MGPFLLCHIWDPYSPGSHYAVLCRINVVGWMVGGGFGLHLWRHTVTTPGTRGVKPTGTKACCGAGRNWKRRDFSELFHFSGPVWEHRCRWWAGVRKKDVRHGQLEDLPWLLGWLAAYAVGSPPWFMDRWERWSLDQNWRIRQFVLYLTLRARETELINAVPWLCLENVL